MPKMQVLPTQAEVIELRPQRRALKSLEDAAASINQHIALYLRGKENCKTHRLKAGQELVIVRKRIPEGEWEKWCALNIKRGMRDIRRLIQIAEAVDPVAALEREQARVKDAMARQRADRRHVTPVADDQVEHIICLIMKLNEDQRVELMSRLKEIIK